MGKQRQVPSEQRVGGPKTCLEVSVGFEPRFLGHSVRSLVNIPTELHVTAWSTYWPSGKSQTGQQTDRAASHNLVNKLQVALRRT
jgi:hypothetical protein